MEERAKELVEGTMSLYNTIEVEGGKENNYTNADDKIKEILNGEEPLFISEEDSVARMLFQYLNVGYGLVGIKYLDKIFENKTIAANAVGYALQLLNEKLVDLLEYESKYGKLHDDNEKKVEVNEAKGIE